MGALCHLAHPERFKFLIAWFVVRHSIQLSYRLMMLFFQLNLCRVRQIYSVKEQLERAMCLATEQDFRSKHVQKTLANLGAGYCGATK